MSVSFLIFDYFLALILDCDFLKMEPSHLELEELKYECEIRAIVFEDEAKATRALRKRLREERKDVSLRPKFTTLSPDDEIPICRELMLELNEFVVLNRVMKSAKSRAQLYSRLCHFETRVARMDLTELSQTEVFTTALNDLKLKGAFLRKKYFSDLPAFMVDAEGELIVVVEEPTPANTGETSTTTEGAKLEPIEVEEDLFGDDDLISALEEFKMSAPKLGKDETPEVKQKVSLNFSQMKTPNVSHKAEAGKQQPRSTKPHEKARENPQGGPAKEALPQKGVERPMRSSTPEPRYHTVQQPKNRIGLTIWV